MIDSDLRVLCTRVQLGEKVYTKGKKILYEDYIQYIECFRDIRLPLGAKISLSYGNFNFSAENSLDMISNNKHPTRKVDKIIYLGFLFVFGAFIFMKFR